MFNATAGVPISPGRPVAFIRQLVQMRKDDSKPAALELVTVVDRFLAGAQCWRGSRQQPQGGSSIRVFHDYHVWKRYGVNVGCHRHRKDGT